MTSNRRGIHISRYFSALSARNYRLFFTGQVISLLGTWMTQTASLWLIYHLSGSAFLLGLTGFASQFPIFVLAPFAGVWIDRVNRRHLLIVTQIASLLQSLALAAFAFTHSISAGILVFLNLVQGMINAFDMPARQASVLEFVEKREHLSNAIALNSAMFNLARLVAPALAGFVIAAFTNPYTGTGVCFSLDAASYLAVIVSLLLIRLQNPARATARRHPMVELQEGIHYAFGFAPIRALIVLAGLVSFTGFSYAVLTPIFARDVFHGDARTLGWLMSASGVGALSGALYLGARVTIRGLGNVITIGGGLMASGLVGFSISPWLPLSLACLALTGLGGVLLMASSNTLVQSLVEENKRGRVMSFFTMAFTGTMPIGNLVMGLVASRLGAAAALRISGAICAVVVFFFYRELPRLRRAAAPALARLGLAQAEPVLYPPDEKQAG